MSHRRVSLFLALLVAAPGALLLVAPAGAASSATATDVTITSFDGTSLASTLFVPAGADAFHPVPFVLMTHGWGGARTATLTGRVADLVASGYGVLTWDSRGFGASGGEVMLDSPNFEVRDVSAIITWLQGHAPVQMVGEKPLVGMSGGSYAGGIQLLSAAFDDRIVAIAPEITWNDLSQALGPNGVPKMYWTSLLFGSGAAASCADLLTAKDTHSPATVTTAAKAGVTDARPTSGCQTSDLAKYYAEVHATNTIPQDVKDALLFRSPKTYMSNIKVPTLLIQGFPDTLFDVDQAVANFRGIQANGAPVKLWIYDGGHSHPEDAAQVPNTQGGLISQTVIDWMDCHLKTTHDCSRVGAPVQYWTGSQWLSSTSWPPVGVAVTKHVNGIPPLVMGALPDGDAGQTVLKVAAGPLATTGSVHVAFNVSSNAPEAFLFLSVAVMGPDGKLNSSWGQVQPFRVATAFTGALSHVEADLVSVHADVPAGSSLALVVATAHRDYDNSRVPAFVDVQDVDITAHRDA